jgi:hypothetical protein
MEALVEAIRPINEALTDNYYDETDTDEDNWCEHDISWGQIKTLGAAFVPFAESKEAHDDSPR